MDAVTPIERRCEWLAWANKEIANNTWGGQAEVLRWALPVYAAILSRADTFTMNPHFQQLVDVARVQAPDDLTFDPQWLIAKWGWCWLEQPFEVPMIKAALDNPHPNDQELTKYYRHIRAVGWRVIETDTKLPDNARTPGSASMRLAKAGDVQVCCYQEMPGQGFNAWSWFVLAKGERVGDRVKQYEQMNVDADDGSNYVIYPDGKARKVIDDPGAGYVVKPGDTIAHPKHELRWVYAAFHLMAQKLSTTIQVPTDRATRRRLERQNQIPPPFIKIITLRRLELDRKRAGNPSDVDWQWQWSVDGHWRNQYYPSEGVHKRIFIESYIKGPADKPLKPGQLKLYSAKR